MLGTHTGTSQLLKSAIAKIKELSANQKQAGDELGQGVSPDLVSAAAPSRNDNYVGEKTGSDKESDRVLMAGLGLPVSTPAG